MKKIAAIMCLIISLMLSACGENYAATAGGHKISVGELNFYLTSIKNQMSGTELASDDDWQNQEIEGMKAMDFAKERALETAGDNIAYVEISDYLKLELTDDDKANIKSIKNNLIKQYGGDTGYKKFLKSQDINESFIDMLCKSMICSEKLADIAVSENPITDEERSEEFNRLSEEGNYKAKHILILSVNPDNMQPLPQDEQDEAKSTAQQILARVQNGEDFDALMNEYSQDPGLAQNPDGYVFSDGQMDENFENCTKGLAIGEIGFTESAYGYHIIKRLPLEQSDLESAITSSLRAKKLSDAMEKWKEEDGFTIVKNTAVFDSVE